jgi:hypothetical protein
MSDMGWVVASIPAPSMDPDTRPGGCHQASGLEPQVPLKQTGLPGTELSTSETEASFQRRRKTETR